jgi:chemotaxis protein MotB
MSAPRRGHGRLGHQRGHEEEHEEHENHERWLVSYADMMTLLMVLFIVMFAISSINQGKFDQLKQGLHNGFGTPQTMMAGGNNLLDSGDGVAPDDPQIASVAQGGAGGVTVNSAKGVAPAQVAGLVKATEQAQVREEVQNLKKAEAALKAALKKAGIPNGATFRFDERGLVVTIATDKVLFESGSATLRRQGRLILDTIEPTLAKLPNRISVDGHTNSLPIATDRFPSNWELSTDRATGVLRYLARPGGIPVDRMSAAGYADTRPLLPASDPAALVKNRRVEIVVLAGVDDSLGRAVAQLGQDQQSSGATPGSSSRRTGG